MALPKSARRIIVEGSVYRWLIGHGKKYFTLAVEAEEVKSQKLLMQFRRSHVYERYGDDKGAYGFIDRNRPCGPDRVRQLILAALGEGWQPNVKGKPFSLDVPKTAPTRRMGEVYELDARQLMSDILFYVSMKPKIYERLHSAKPGENFPVYIWGQDNKGLTFSIVKERGTRTVKFRVVCNEFPKVCYHYVWH